MTDQKPDAGDITPSNDNTATPSDPEEVEPAAEQPQEAEAAAPADAEAASDQDAEAAEEMEADALADDAPAEEAEDAQAGEGEASETEDVAAAADGEAAPGVVAETEAEAADAAAAGAAWTTTPVAPDPEATEAALAALAAKPEVTLEPPETPPLPPPGDEEDEGTPVLLVGGILVGAFVVALAIVLILFRPFDSLSDPDASLSPSPVVTEEPSESPSAIATVGTPDFVSLPLEEAEATATDYGLVVRVNPVETDEAEPGTVLAQDPVAGEMVEEGSTIELSVAQPVPTASVPDVAGLSEEEARDALEDAGFVVGEVSYETSDEVEDGNVISTDPEIDTELPRGTTVDLVVSSGPEILNVPDVTGLDQEDSTQVLEDAGFVVGEIIEEFSDDVPAGDVIRTDPATDSNVPAGSQIDLIISLGPALTAVPDIVDLPEAEALDALDAAGLAAGAMTEASSETIVAGNVISSDPVADSEVAPGTAVAYVLSTGPALTAVPDIVDLPEAEALDALDAAGLAAGAMTEASSETIVAGNVISSDPVADSEVAPGTAVAYVLSTGPALTAVPDIVDLPEAEALDALDAAGLAAGAMTEASSETIVAGNVISSDPVADSEVAPGTAVAYVLSTGPALTAVPDIVDLPEAEALDALDAAGLAAGAMTEASSETIVAGNVISSDPVADSEVAPGTAVAYVLSTGPALTAVPDIVDLPEAEALDALDAAGLAAGAMTEASSETIVAGNVISSDPVADSEVAPGTAVAYVLSTGPALTAVPDIVDLPEAEALDALDAAGLAAGAMTEASSETIVAGNVISSDPVADSEVAPGTAVAYVLSTGPALTAVPDIVDLPEAEALDALDAAGLAAGAMTEASSETIVAGNVISSDPVADSEVAPGTAVAYVLSTGPALTAVPDIVDLPEAEALDALDAAGLAAGAMTEASSETIVAGNVISSDPVADSEVAPGTAVAYVLSTGPALTAVPDIVDLPEAEALDAITAAGLVVGDAGEAYSDSVPAGDIISQDPAAGTQVELGTAVSYVASLGVQQVEVPDLSGPAADVEQQLADASLVAGAMREAYSDTVPAGNIISQAPAAGAMVDIGSAVDYVVSLGVETVAVPELSGSAADAPDAITAAGLVVGDAGEAYSDSVPAGDIISQDPAAGTQVELGTAVSYVASLGVQQVEVPDLSGPAADVEQQLADASLVAGAMREAYSDTVPAGNIISQAPAAGAMVDIGSAVDYVVSLGVETVAVPELSGSAADAPDAITAAGLVVGDAGEAYSDSVPAGDIISQDPAAGTQVELGTAVSYVASLGVQQVEVPDLSGPAADVEQQLADASLVAGAMREAYSDTVPAGNIISQAPAAGAMVDIGSAVDYVVSLGVETVAVPELSGSAADAPDAITAAGLVVGDAGEAYSDSVPAGDIISQDPAAGTQVELGTAVSYVASLGVQQVEVPDLSGPAADVEQQLADASLVAGAMREAYSDTVPAGNIISQAPAAGAMVDIGSAVDYVVSLGVETVAVPELSGSAADAPDAITAAGLVVGDAGEAYSDSVPAGDIISQDPAAGTQVELGTAVSYVASLGVQQVEVPDLSGPAADVEQQLADASLVAGAMREAYSDTVPAGNIISQAPAAGAMVDIGSAVDYVVSLGVETVAVPELSGSAADAPDAITAAGLVVGDAGEAYSDSVPAGDIISQDPAAGTQVELGTAVSYVASLGVQQVEVPDLSGPAADVEQQLADASLVAGAMREAYSDTVPAGNIISQAPAAGAMVDIGSAVDYVVSLGVETVAVPELSGSAADAPDAITAAGLVVGDAGEAYSDSVPAGDIISQDPAAGTQVELGTAVSYVASLGVQQVEVPDLSGPAADVEQQLADASLVAGAMREAYSDTVPAGNIISQAPAAGAMVDIGSAVDYVVSLGVETVAVPELSGSAAEAPDAITAAGLVVGDAGEAYSDSVPAGDIISQDPAAGTQVELGTAVSYVASLGVQQVEVPAVRELSQEDATAALEAAGLNVGEVLERNNENVPAGAALRTDPGVGEMVDLGSTVSLYMSIGPEQVDVPDVIGLPESEAISAIESAKLLAGASSDQFSDTIAAGSVVSTSPAAGVTVDANSTVDYVLSRGVEQIAVPDVGDMTQAEATQAIEAAGLRAGETTSAYDEIIAAGNVVSQSPASGTEIDKGAAVDLVISDGPTPFVNVPATRGLPEAEAIAAVEAAQLVVGETIYRTHENVAAGAAIRTEPAEGDEVLLGEAVGLYVSTGSKFRTIPDVSGQEASAAQAALEAEDLTVAPDERNNARFPAGQAVKTEPAAGTRVEVGDEVTLVVSMGPVQVDVPDVVGLNRPDARTAITDASLTVGDETVVEDDAPQNTVIGQDPPAGGQADRNSAVDITVSSGPPQVVIPVVRDVPAGDAQAALEDLGLVVETRLVFHAKVAEGDVIKTDPADGTPVDIGSTVTMNVSKGPKPVPVPDVVGSKKGAATTAIEDAGLTVGEQSTVEDAAAKNTVIAQDPAAGSEVPTGTAVTLTISSGPPMAEIPDVRDMPAADAQSQLEGLGLVVEAKEVFHAGVAAGNAIKTTPAAGESVAVGSTVSMNVSKGPKPVEVPDVVGQKKGAATTAITDAGLTVGEETSVEDAAAANTVIAQDPAAGSEAPSGSVVNLTVSSGPPVVEIPEIRGVEAAEAQATLEGLGLVVEINEVHHASVAAGDAIKTTPAAGETVDLGSSVKMNVSKGPKPVSVPDVVGSMRAAATTAIEDAGLVVGEQTTVEDAADRNTVLSQDPAAGSEVATGTAVDITVSSGPSTATIPAVRDVAAADAQAQLEALGFVVEINEVHHANVAAGNAIKTTPPAGESAAAGSTVKMNVSKGPKPVEVPDLIGLKRAAARTAIEDAGLTVGDETSVEDVAAANTVIAQDPAAGSTADAAAPVSITVSSGPPSVEIPDVRDQSAARAVNDLENLGLVVETKEVFHAKVAAGDAIKTTPPAGESVEVGSTVTVNISKGIKQVTVPNLVGLAEADVEATLTEAELKPGTRAEAENEAAPGTVVDQSPAEGSTVDKSSTVDYTVSSGAGIEQMGLGGDLDSSEVMSQLDVIASQVEPIRELQLSNTPYDGSNSRQHVLALAERIDILRDPDAIKAEERALKRLGLLDEDDDLAALLEALYGQSLPVAYFEDDGHLSVLESIDELDPAQRAQAAREMDRALVDQTFGLGSSRISDKSRGDEALAVYALEQGDGTATMLDWSAGNGNNNRTNDVIIPGDDAIYASMPLILQREYSLPFLEGRIFVDRLRDSGGWAAVNEAWGRPPESTEQILHPRLYPDERPTTVVMDGIAGRLGNGWNEQWQQTMGELRVGVWLANGAAGEQSGPRAAVKLPRANAAAGWGGDRLVSLGGPDGQWAIVWQTKWDSEQDTQQFVNAAERVIADLGGAGLVVRADVSSGVSNPALVLIASSDDTLAAAAGSLGVAVASPS